LQWPDTGVLTEHLGWGGAVSEGSSSPQRMNENYPLSLSVGATSQSLYQARLSGQQENT